MRKSHLLVSLAGSFVVLGMAALHVSAQQPGVAPQGYQQAPRAPQPVALLDLNRIFKEHPRFQGDMQALKDQVQQAETTMQARRAELQRMAGVLKTMNAGTLDYKSTEGKLAEDTAKLQAEVQMQRKDFLEKESKIYHTAYQEVLQLVDWYATNNGYVAVLRFNSEQADPNDPESILRDINKPVIWHAQGTDITNAVLGYLNQRGAQRPQAPAAQPGAPRSGGIPIQR